MFVGVDKMNENYFIILVLVCTLTLSFGDDPSNGDQLVNVYQGNYCSNDIQETIKFLKRGAKEFKINDNYRNVILLTGNTGSGKSTLSQFIAGNLADLRSVSSGGDGFHIQYKDEGVIKNYTTFPDLLIDESNNAFYDFPDYDDTRTISAKFANTYFIKKVVDHTTTLKIVLVVNYASVRENGSREFFSSLIKHTKGFLTDLSNFKDSISLIATKVGGAGGLKPDGEVIDTIVVFLKGYVSELNKEEDSDDKKYALEIVNILLQSKDAGKTYEKISIFQHPDKEGPLDKIELMVEERQKMRDMVINRTTFGVKHPKDFGFNNITDVLKKELSENAKCVNVAITENVKNISAEILNYFDKKENKLGNLNVLAKQFRKAVSALSSIKQSDKDLDATKLIKQLVNVTTTIGIPISHEHVRDVINFQRYILFLQEFIPDNLPLLPKDWEAGLKECITVLNETTNWFSFLAEIYDHYSQYDIQSDLAKYNVSNIADWGHDGKPQGIFINSDNFWTFVEKQQKTAIIQTKNPGERRLAVLNNLLDITLKQVQTATCEDGSTKLVVKGDYVLFKKINFDQCGNTTHTIQIFALHTVFIDDDIKGLGKSLNVSIIAPNWYIHGDVRQIDLSGANNEYKFSADAKASDRLDKSNKGSPGKPGQNTGNFIGCGLTFQNGNKLTIIEIGGKGSAGQNGGSGFVQQLTDADIKKIGKAYQDGRDIYDLHYTVKNTQKIKCSKSAGLGYSKEDCETRYEVYPKCSIGGDGGKGGKGGRYGQSNIFYLGDKSTTIINVVQKIGPDGEGGKGGKFRTAPQQIKLLYEHHRFNGFRVGGSTSSDWKVESRKDDEACLAHKQPADGANTDGIVEPELIPLELYRSLNEFEEYVRFNQQNKIKRNDLMQFIKQIHDSPAVLANSSVRGFADELLKLEGQFYQLQHDIDLEYYYLSASNRIDQFVGKLNKSATSLEELKVFNYLYTAAWSKFLSFNSSESLMVIDIDSYLTLTGKNIKKYEESLRQQTLDKARQSYKQEIENKIQEARSIIDDDILPKIAEISGSIDDILETIVNETVEFAKEVETEIEQYREKQAELCSQLIFRSLFRVLDVVSGLGSMLGPYGIAAAAAAKSVSQIGTSFLDNDGYNKLKDIPAGVITALDGWNEKKKKQQENQVEALDKAIDEMKQQADSTESLKEISDKMKDLKDKLAKEKEKGTPDANKIKAIENDMVEWMGKQKEKFQNVDEAAKKKWENINTIMSVATTAVDEFLKFSDDLSKIKEIDNAIEASKGLIKDFYTFQDEIYSKMWPMVDEMRKTLDDIERGLKNKPHAALDLKKWEIQSILRDTKVQLNTFIEEFEEEENLVDTVPTFQEELKKIQQNMMDTFQKLDEAFDTMIKIYDRIDSYYDQEKLGDFIASVATKDTIKIKVTDPVLSLMLDRLDVIISANVILNEYKLAIDAFKQSVFPFADYYLQQFRLPANLTITNSTDNLISKAVNNIEGLKSKIEEYDKSVINGNDKFITTAFFNDSLAPASWAFIEWPSAYNLQSIADLFAGKEISIFADITQARKVNAVKFNIVELAFKTTLQQDALNAQLMKFKIHMKHTGNSHYRCGASIYSIESPSLELEYSFEKVNGVPVHQNEVYEKIKNGSKLLSPYTMWTIRLENISEDSNAFDKLKPFAGSTDLLLNGHGQYVTNDVTVCNRNLNDYYNEEK